LKVGPNHHKIRGCHLFAIIRLVVDQYKDLLLRKINKLPEGLCLT
jgi:hypothetical protein